MDYNNVVFFNTLAHKRLRSQIATDIGKSVSANILPPTGIKKGHDRVFAFENVPHENYLMFDT